MCNLQVNISSPVWSAQRVLQSTGSIEVLITAYDEFDWGARYKGYSKSFFYEKYISRNCNMVLKFLCVYIIHLQAKGYLFAGILRTGNPIMASIFCYHDKCYTGNTSPWVEIEYLHHAFINYTLLNRLWIFRMEERSYLIQLYDEITHSCSGS